MSHQAFMDACLWAVAAVAMGMPIWLVLWPPRRVRTLPLFVRPVLATVCSEAAIYFFIFCIVYPVAAAYGRAHPGVLQCYSILCLPPSCTWIPTAGVSLSAFTVRQLTLYLTKYDENTW